MNNEDFEIVKETELIEVESCCGKTACRNQVKKWFIAKIVKEDIFLNLINYLERNTLKELSERWDENPKITKDKVLNIENDILSKGNYEHFAPLIVRNFSDAEKKEFKDKEYYLEDGFHRSLAIADLLCTGKIDFGPIKIYFGDVR